MADTPTPSTQVPIPRTLEPPPRTTGNAQQDFPIVLDWFYRAYQVIQQSVAYINQQVNTGDGDLSLANLPNPDDTTLAQAQQTANDAYILANQADILSKALNPKVTQALLDIDEMQDLWLGLLSGTFTISGTDIGVALTFSTAQADTNYKVIFQPVGFVGTPPDNAFIVKQKTYTVGDVTVTMIAAPGVANSVTWEWQLIRNS